MARIGIDLARRIGTVDRRIFGNFIEHLGRCIYGGIYEEGSPLSDARGFRTDVLEAVRPLRVPLLRWPGGNFVSGYHWLDGGRAQDQRPRRTELAWYAEESNRFGTLEFIEYCREIEAEPFICVNMGSGTMDEAQAWVEYCNGTGKTSWANLRRQHGHAEPYRVSYWGLGNEMYGSWQIGNLRRARLREEGARLRHRDEAHRSVHPAHRLRAERVERRGTRSSSAGSPTSSTSTVSTSTRAAPTTTPRCSSRTRRSVRCASARRSSSGSALRPADRPSHRTSPSTSGTCGIGRGATRTEWAVWRSATTSPTPSPSRPTSTASSATADAVKIANFAQLVNAIAPIFTSPQGFFLQTIYHPLRLYAEHTPGDRARRPCERRDL